MDTFKDLAARHDALMAEAPGMRIRDRARKLRVTEGELVARQLGVTARPIACKPVEIYPKLGSLGRILCLARNEWAVHERYGQFQMVEVNPKVGLVLGTDIDLRLFFSKWTRAWEVNDNGRISLQFFDREGVAIQKIFQTDNTDLAAWQKLVDEFALAPAAGRGAQAADPSPVQAAGAAVAAGAGAPSAAAVSVGAAAQAAGITPEQAAALLAVRDAPVFEPLKPAVTDHGATLDEAARLHLRNRWLAMTDPHQLWPMLQELKLSRITALANVGEDLCQQTDLLAIEKVLQYASEHELPIMVFAGNHAAVQIHGGTVKKLMRAGPWFNILDPNFNLHVNTDAAVSSWVVNRPTDDGPVTSLELYADNGDIIVQFFGLRKPGNPGLKAWRALMEGLCAKPLHR